MGNEEIYYVCHEENSIYSQTYGHREGRQDVKEQYCENYILYAKQISK